MLFFRKTLFRKFLFLLVVLLLLAGGVGFLLQKFPFLPLPPPFVFAALLAFFAFVVFLFFLASVMWPLRKIITQMKAMITGRRYNKIYTSRVDEWSIVAHFFNEVTRNLERIAPTVEEGKRMSSELEIASGIQKNVLPKVTPDVPGLEIYANTRAAVEVGGDSYDIIRAGQNTFMYLGDVTGHGVPAGLVMMMVNTLIHLLTEMHSSGYEVLVNTNRQLKPKIKPTMFMTLVMLRWNDQEKKMYLTGAGHEHVMIYRRAQNICEVLKTGGIAIGMLPDNSKILREEVLIFDPGDTIVLYTDGIIEAKNMKGEQFGLERLKQTIEKYGPISKTPHELFSSISSDFASFVEDQTQQDDISLIIIKRPAS